MTDRKKDGLSILGFGAAACVACCAGPILVFLGGLGVAGLASTLLIGTAGFLIAGAAVVAVVVFRRRQTSCAVLDDTGPVEVAAPTRRTSVSSETLRSRGAP